MLCGLRLSDAFFYGSENGPPTEADDVAVLTSLTMKMVAVYPNLEIRHRLCARRC